MTRKIVRSLTGIFAWLVMTGGADAISAEPDLLVKQTTDRVIQELTNNRDTYMKDNTKLYDMVDAIVLQHFDFERMSKLVLGKHWRKASDEQRQKFIEQFRTLLVRTYATALFQYDGQKIIYKPFRKKEGDDQAVVRTEIVPKDGPPVPLHYALSNNGAGAWKVFDIRIDGISLVTNYRTSYDGAIQSDGIDTLISKLEEKNKNIMQQ